ncbi:hypothetical protein B0T26DRAFT_747031 [Lasiosphaeria miniovina]|uniref:Necrosis inducing protein (NPP1) n=1 Tax=Lasiosphaeria miniovina TaxID=1954250 RepID=A0AA40EF42_9PEZI|nr:uncharacterized protein B0T26DRAFT_747031 [Lasiosphaeria miniovina]KAK0735216.1 hypothetical protein B0T26DRAFT_747031 [Lasiosphaeria miniovina]
MRILLSRGLASSLLLLASAAAATTLPITDTAMAAPITDTAMAVLLAGDGVDLALAAAPMWLFSEALRQVPCYPTHATDADGQQTPSAALCSYPKTGCNCRNPGVLRNHAGPPFPIYYSVRRCDLAEVRVAYNIFFEKDGCSPDVLGGHRYDWERVIVVWQRAGGNATAVAAKNRDKWAPARLLLGQHAGYESVAWGSIENTFHKADAGRPRGGPNGRTGREHAKVYVSWSKHATYHTRRTGWIDPLSQLTWNAYRGEDWWYFPEKGDYLQADASTPLGATIAGFDWGHADSFPARVHEKLCKLSSETTVGITRYRYWKQQGMLHAESWWFK